MTLQLFVAAVLAALLGVAPAAAQIATPDPYAHRDHAWIMIDGTVDSVSADQFILDYGPGRITVEMDDGDRDADGYKLIKGDMVRVSGRVDRNLLAATTIEASSVYVESLGTHFFASSVDDEERIFSDSYPLVISSTTLRGKVERTDDDSFMLATEGGTIRVQTESLGYDPLDDQGYQRIRKGDLVLVRGDLDTGFFDIKRELEAEMIVVLRDAEDRPSAAAAVSSGEP